MKVQDLGSVQISRVVEIDSLPFNPKALFGNCDLDLLRANRDWIGDTYVDWGSEALTLWLSFHTFVVRTKHHTILVDTCLGNHKQRPSQPAWHMLDIPFLDRLRQVACRPSRRHRLLHPPARRPRGLEHPTRRRPLGTDLPNARYIVGRREYERWLALHTRTRRSRSTAAPSSTACCPSRRRPPDLVDDDHFIERELDTSVWLRAPRPQPRQRQSPCQGTHGHAVMSGDVIHHPIQLAQPDWYCAIDDDIAAGTARASASWSASPTPIRCC